MFCKKKVEELNYNTKINLSQLVKIEEIIELILEEKKIEELIDNNQSKVN